MLQNTSVQGLTASGKTWLSNTSITGPTDINVTGTATTTIGNSGGLVVAGNASLRNVSSQALTTGPLWAGATTLGVTGTGGLTAASLSVTGNGTVTGTLGVTGATTLGTLVATGNSSVQNVSAQALTVGPLWAGSTTLASSSVTGNSTVTGTFGVTALTTLSGGATVTGTTLINSTGSSNTTIGNTGTITLNGTVNATGLSGYATTTALNLKANTADPTFTGTVTIPAGAVITGYATTGDVNLKANIANPIFRDNATIETSSNTNGNITNLVFFGCMTAPQSDAAARRTADICSGYSGPSHGTEYISFGTGIGTGLANNNRSRTTERMRITATGCVGIGTLNPDYPLHVATTVQKLRDTTLAAWWANMGGTSSSPVGGTGQFNVDVGIYTHSMLLSSTLYIQSDRRIKTNIVDVEDDRALRDLRLLKPKTYMYKDTITRGDQPVYGFIAQEVKEVLDYASYYITDTIPNIYRTATFMADILTLTFNTTDLSRDASGALFTKLRIKTRELKDEFVNILEVIDEHTLRVDKDLTEWGGVLDASGQMVPGDKIFVYGQEVNDFHNLNKDAIWTVATAALQEVDRQLQAEKQKTATLETTLTSTQATLASTQATLASTQETLAALVARVNALEQR